MFKTLMPLPGWSPPQIFNIGNADEKALLQELIDRGDVLHYSDQIERSVLELYHARHPDQIEEVVEQQYKDFLTEYSPLVEYGAWVYYPWSRSLVHFPNSHDLNILRTSRNRDLVTADEQRILRRATILVVGLSVGSSVLDAMLLQGMGGTLIIVDNDSLDPTNLNRIKAPFADVGQHKVDVAAKKISETDPYIEQIHYRDGLSVQNLDEIFTIHNPDIVVDEMDHLALKILLRKKAQQYRKPVLMATDDGDDALIDIERYDSDPAYRILHGSIPDEIIAQILEQKTMSRQQAGMIIGKYFVGYDHVPMRMMQSLQRIGVTLPSWPQLGGAASIAGVLVAYAAKKILLDQPIRSGRFLVGPDAVLNPLLDDEQYLAELASMRKRLADGVGT